MKMSDSRKPPIGGAAPCAKREGKVSTVTNYLATNDVRLVRQTLAGSS